MADYFPIQTFFFVFFLEFILIVQYNFPEGAEAGQEKGLALEDAGGRGQGARRGQGLILGVGVQLRR